MAEQGKWITFEDAGASKSGKTRRWSVMSKDGGGRIGKIYWFPGWRRYVFEPNGDAVRIIFEQDCLRDLAAFVEDRTAEHRAAGKAAGPTSRRCGRGRNRDDNHSPPAAPPGRPAGGPGGGGGQRGGAVMTDVGLRAGAQHLVDTLGPSEGYNGLEWHWALHLARAYLAEHPADDGEPAHVESMLREAGVSIPPGGFGWCHGVFTGTNACGTLTFNLNMTKGQVRRLLAALGVPLPE